MIRRIVVDLPSVSGGLWLVDRMALLVPVGANHWDVIHGMWDGIHGFIAIRDV